MKSYDETVDSVFDRIDKYNSEKIRRNKIITKAVVPACCFCLIALGGIGAKADCSNPGRPVPYPVSLLQVMTTPQSRLPRVLLPTASVQNDSALPIR